MTNYNERLDEILDKFVDGCDCRIDEGQAYLHQSEFAADEAKQLITSLIKELVEEARIDELNDVPFEAGSPAEEHYKLRIAELSKESTNE